MDRNKADDKNVLLEKIAALEKRLEDKSEAINRRIDDNKESINRTLVVVGLLLAALSFGSMLYFIETKVSAIAEKKINDVATEDFVKKIIEEKGEPQIAALFSSMRHKADEDYGKFLNKINNYKRDGEKVASEWRKAFKQESDSVFKNDVEKDKYYQWYVKGLVAYENNEFTEAAEAFEDALKIKQTPSAFSKAATCFALAGMHDKALNYFEKAVDLYPSNEEILSDYVAVLWFDIKDYERVNKWFSKLISVAPNDAGTLNDYAVFLYQYLKRDYDKAEKYFERAIKINPQPIYLGNYADFLAYIRSDYINAEKYYNLSLVDVPKYSKYALNHRRYAKFLSDICNDNVKADYYLKKAEEVERKQ